MSLALPLKHVIDCKPRLRPCPQSQVFRDICHTFFLRFFHSVDEWAYYDVPAMIDFVLHSTGHAKLYLVTYSMSSAVFLATVSARPEYNDKVIVSYHLAPFVAFTNIRSVLLRIGVQLGQIFLVRKTRIPSLNRACFLGSEHGVFGGPFCWGRVIRVIIFWRSKRTDFTPITLNTY